MCLSLIGTFIFHVISLVIVTGIFVGIWWVIFHALDDYVEQGGRNELLLWLRGLLAHMLIFAHLGLETSVDDRENRWRGRVVLASLFIATALCNVMFLGWFAIFWGVLSLLLLAVPDDTIDELFKS